MYEFAANKQKLARAIGVVGENEEKVKEEYIKIGGLTIKEHMSEENQEPVAEVVAPVAPEVVEEVAPAAEVVVEESPKVEDPSPTSGEGSSDSSSSDPVVSTDDVA